MNSHLPVLVSLLLRSPAVKDNGCRDAGNFFPFLDAYAGRSTFALSYLTGTWPDLEQWRILGRAKMHELLRYYPKPASGDAEVLETVRKPGYTRHRVRYGVTSDRQTEAFLLVPDRFKQPCPAILALHDHSGFYYYGKEKVTEGEDPPRVLREFQTRVYESRAVADELARRGYVVLVPDAFYFGSQRLDPATLPEEYVGELEGRGLGTDAYIEAFNALASRHEHLVAKTIFISGSTWPGILFQGDRIGVDYLLTRPEVDPTRIGCIGLSLGGLRGAHLFGLDPRLKVGVVAGWMTTYRSLVARHVRCHTWMIYVPGQHAYLDLPDVVTLNAPQPLMVINCLQDRLFPIEGTQAAESKIRSVYERLSASERFACNYYDEPHSLKIAAQEDAFAWFDRWLQR